MGDVRADEAPPRCQVNPPKPKGQGGGGGAEPKLPPSLTSRYNFRCIGREGEEIYIDSNSCDPEALPSFLRIGLLVLVVDS